MAPAAAVLTVARCGGGGGGGVNGGCDRQRVAKEVMGTVPPPSK